MSIKKQVRQERPKGSSSSKTKNSQQQHRPPTPLNQDASSTTLLEQAKTSTEDDGFKTVTRKRTRRKSKVTEPVEAEKPNPSRRRLHKKQAVILERPTGSASYADTLKKAKAAVLEKNLPFDITARRAKSGNIVFEIPDKEQADQLAETLRTKMGDSVGIRRPLPSVPILLIGIEDSIGPAELKSTLAKFDSDLESLNDIDIKEGKNGVRSTIIRAPLRAGLKLIEARKIKVGWAMCRIREFERVAQRCDKCKNTGHTSKVCTGPERRKCFRCKQEGHLIAVCSQQGAMVPIEQKTSE